MTSTVSLVAPADPSNGARGRNLPPGDPALRIGGVA